MLLRAWIIFFLILLLGGCQPPRGVYHTVKPGQTLYRISKSYGIDEKYVARLNGITDPTRLRAGEKLFIPGASKKKSVPVSAPPQSSPPKTAVRGPSPAKKAPATAPRNPVASTPAAEAPVIAKSPAGKAPPAQKGQFIWPLRGEILSQFASKGSGPSKGIEIGAGKGAPVHAAAAGQVIYSDSGIRGYGNLIIIKHQGSFFTVYGYNRDNRVKAGTFVGKGDKIASVGAPPSGGSPRLYFEVRYGKQAVDPIFYLP